MKKNQFKSTNRDKVFLEANMKEIDGSYRSIKQFQKIFVTAHDILKIHHHETIFKKVKKELENRDIVIKH
jgi:hypothetical protein